MANRWKNRNAFSYLEDLHIVPRPQFNGQKCCPKCQGFLLKDLIVDLACLNCGWRESCYFGKDESIDTGLLARLMYNSVDVLQK